MDPFCYLYFVFACHTVLSVTFSLVVTCWERADLLALLYVMFSCCFFFVIYFPMWCPGLGVALECIDSGSLPSSFLSCCVSFIYIIFSKKNSDTSSTFCRESFHRFDETSFIPRKRSIGVEGIFH